MAENWEDVGAKDKGWEDADTSFAPKPPRAGPEPKDLGPRREIGKEELAGAAGAGAAAGFFTPELTRGIGKGASGLGRILQATPFPPARGIGRFLETTGRGMETYGTQMKAAPLVGRRVLPSALGAAGGLTGEAAGQATEAFGYGGAPAEAARFVGGMAVPTGAAVGRTGSRYGNLLLDVANRYAYGEPAKKEISAIERERIGGLLEQLRGTSPEGEAGQRIYKQLEDAVAAIEQKTAGRVQRMEQAVPRIEAGIEGRRSAAQANLSQIGNVNATPTDIGERARRMVVGAQQEFENLRGTAYDTARNEVNQIVNTKQNAGQFIEGTKAFQDLEKYLQGKTLTGRVGLEQPMATATERGVVSAYEGALNAIRNRRVVIGNSDSAEAVRLAQDLKSKGLRVIERTDPTTNVTVYEREFPTAYEAIDDFRRRLGQSAKFGEPVTGYEALSAQNAKDLYNRVSKVQEEFVGEPFKVMQNVYEQGSRALEPYAGKAGKKYAGINFDDPTRFKTDPKQLVNEAFGSRQGVDDLLRLSNNNTKEVEALARDYIASAISGKSVKEAENILARNKDMLSHPSMANVRNQFMSYINNLKTVEAAAERGKATVKVLGKEIPAVTAASQKLADEIIKDEQFAVGRIKSLILGGNQKEWRAVASVIGNTPKGRLDLLNAVRETIAEAAASSPDKAVKTFKEKIAPALPMAGIPQASVESLGRQLDEIARYAYDPAKLDMMGKLMLGFTKYYGAPRAGAAVGEQVEGQLR